MCTWFWQIASFSCKGTGHLLNLALVLGAGCRLPISGVLYPASRFGDNTAINNNTIITLVPTIIEHTWIRRDGSLSSFVHGLPSLSTILCGSLMVQIRKCEWLIMNQPSLSGSSQFVNAWWYNLSCTILSSFKLTIIINHLILIDDFIMNQTVNLYQRLMIDFLVT